MPTFIFQVQKHPSSSSKQLEETHPKLKGIDPQLVELVMSEIMDHGPRIGWDDIAGMLFWFRCTDLFPCYKHFLLGKFEFPRKPNYQF